MARPGWYNDKEDPALARYHDGDGWTHHTIVKADWVGRGTPPPPEPDWVEEPAGLVGRYRAWPVWGRIAVPLAVVAISVGLVSTAGGGGSTPRTTTTTSPRVGIEDSIQIASQGLKVRVYDYAMKALIYDLCDAATSGSTGPPAQDAIAITQDAAGVLNIILSAGKGARAFCPDDLAVNPHLMQEVYAVAMASLPMGTSSSAPTSTMATTTTTTPTTTTEP